MEYEKRLPVCNLEEEEEIAAPLVDNYDLETKRNVINDHINNHLTMFAVAHKYGVPVPLVLEWVRDSDRILSDKYAAMDRKQKIKREAKKIAKKMRRPGKPKFDYSEIPKPRILPLQEILDNIEKRKVPKGKRGIEMWPSEKKKVYSPVLFDTRYFTYKTFYTNEEDVIEVWGESNISTAPNAYFDLKYFQNFQRAEVDIVQLIKDEVVVGKRRQHMRDKRQEKKEKEMLFAKLAEANEESNMSTEEQARIANEHLLLSESSGGNLTNSSDDIVELVRKLDDKPTVLLKNEDKRLSDSSSGESVPDEARTTEVPTEVEHLDSKLSVIDLEQNLRTIGATSQVSKEEVSGRKDELDSIIETGAKLLSLKRMSDPILQPKGVETSSKSDKPLTLTIEEVIGATFKSVSPFVEIKSKATRKPRGKKLAGKEELNIPTVDDVTEKMACKRLRKTKVVSDEEDVTKPKTRKQRAKKQPGIEMTEETTENITEAKPAAKTRKPRAKKSIEIPTVGGITDQDVPLETVLPKTRKPRAKKNVEIMTEDVTENVIKTRKTRNKKLSEDETEDLMEKVEPPKRRGRQTKVSEQTNIEEPKPKRVYKRKNATATEDSELKLGPKTVPYGDKKMKQCKIVKKTEEQERQKIMYGGVFSDGSEESSRDRIDVSRLSNIQKSLSGGSPDRRSVQPQTAIQDFDDGW